MQYGLRVENYKRVKKGENIISNERVEKYIILFFISLFVSRAIILMNKGDLIGLAPFGIALLIAISQDKDFKALLISGVGVFIGTLSVLGRTGDDISNLIVVGVILSVFFVKRNLLDKRTKDKELFFFIFATYIISGLFIGKLELGVNITLTALRTAAIIPIAYVLRYGINSIKEYGSNYLFSLEELISIGILFCLIVSGFGELSLFSVSIRNIIAYFCILCIAFCGGGTYGAAIGTTMGIIVGLNSGDMTLGISVFATVGLVSGIFRDTGRLFSTLAFLIMFIGMSLYSGNLYISTIIEVLLSGVFFLIIPKKFIDKLQLEVESERKIDGINNAAVEEVKESLYKKVKGVTLSFNAISEALKAPGENDKLLISQKGTALVENLVDRVCSGCVRQEVCWNREFSLTLNSFQTLIENCEDKKMGFPSGLEKKCKKKFELINCAEKIVEKQKGEEVLKGKLGEGRKLIASHIDNITASIEGVLLDYKNDILVDNEIDNGIKKIFNKEMIKYSSVVAYRDVGGREFVKVKLEECDSDIFCKNKVLPLITEVLRKPMVISDIGCQIDPISKECTVIFEEMPKYYIRSYGARFVKNKEEYSGDSYSFGKSSNGKYLTVLSDGMGSGPIAGRESNATINLVEEFLSAGLSKDTSVNMINSIVGLKFDEDEKFSTLDMNVLDLYTGEIEFVKIGGVASFIKRDKEIEIIESNMPPFGLLDSMELDVVKGKVQKGDLIITLSDGVLDIDKQNVGVYSWMKKYLENTTKDPRQLAQDIVNKAKELSGGICNDDMTVVVSKVYSMY